MPSFVLELKKKKEDEEERRETICMVKESLSHTLKCIYTPSEYKNTCNIISIYKNTPLYMRNTTTTL